MREQFKAWSRPTDAEMKELWDNAIFTFDTNTLLNVYRYSEETCNVFFELLEKLKERRQLFLTYQAALEFHKNRNQVIVEQKDKFDHISKALNAVKDVLQKDRRDSTQSELETIINPEIDKLLIRISEMEMHAPDLISQDVYLDRLYGIFEGVVGDPFQTEEAEIKRKDAIVRLENRVAPGFEDYNGQAPEKARKLGDTFIWFQILEYAKTEKKNIILVTDDQKKDWWLKVSHKRTVGPLPELRQEMIDYAKAEFYMYSSEAFIKHAGDYYKLSGESIEKGAEEAREIAEKSSREYRSRNIAVELAEIMASSGIEDLRSSPVLRAAELGQWLESRQLIDDQLPSIREMISQKASDESFKTIAESNLRAAEYLKRVFRDNRLNRRTELHNSDDSEVDENNK